VSAQVIINTSYGNYGIEMILFTAPESEEKQVTRLLAPEQEFTYNTTANGEHKLCIKISDQVYDALPDLKQVRTELYFTNEYRKGMN
jgi:tryptophan synthase alpha subunit